MVDDVSYKDASCSCYSSLRRALATASAAGFESHDVHVNPDKTKLSFALQLRAVAAAAAAEAPADSSGASVMPATVWRSGALGCRSRSTCSCVAITCGVAAPWMQRILHCCHMCLPANVQARAAPLSSGAACCSTPPPWRSRQTTHGEGPGGQGAVGFQPSHHHWSGAVLHDLQRRRLLLVLNCYDRRRVYRRCCTAAGTAARASARR